MAFGLDVNNFRLLSILLRDFGFGFYLWTMPIRMYTQVNWLSRWIMLLMLVVLLGSCSLFRKKNRCNSCPKWDDHVPGLSSAMSNAADESTLVWNEEQH